LQESVQAVLLTLQQRGATRETKDWYQSETLTLNRTKNNIKNTHYHE